MNNRFDTVGSFLRPERLHQARAAFNAGKINAADLKQVEDETIIDLIKKEEEVGLPVVTDGEFRRSWWHLDFFWGLNGVRKASSQTGYFFNDEETRRETAQIFAPIDGQNHPFVEHFKFAQQNAKKSIVKQTLPAPGQFFTELQRPDNLASWQSLYASEEDLMAAIVVAYRQVISDLYAAGCRIIQFDDCTWGALAQWQLHPEQIPTYGIDATQLPDLKNKLVILNNAVLDNQPQDLTFNTHVCRGNYRSTWANSGGYETVADPLFTQENVDNYYLEYDSQRAGGFEPLKQVAGDKHVVLGLVTTKSGALESAADLKQKILDASQYIDLDRLAISPQCGFASTEEGNMLSEAQQWDKVRLVKEVAEDVWK